MSTQGLRVVWRADAPVLVRPVERHLKRFRNEVNGQVRALAARHPRLADLAVSFPALAVALARPRRGFAPESVIALVIAGAPLTELASAASIPLWTRKLPPESFVGPVPVLPDSVDFFRHIANHLPRSGKDASAWFNAVAFGACWGSEQFGAWLAREFIKGRKSLPRWQRSRVVALTLWAWYSRHPDTRAHSLIGRLWTPAIGMKAALAAASTWWNSVDLQVRMGDEPIEDTWLMPGTVDSYSFLPLITALDIEVEARAMQNCLRTMGPHVSENYARLWSVRRDGQRIATMQIGRRWRSPLLMINQLEAARNKPASPDVWWAAQKWLHSQDLLALSGRCSRTNPRLDAALWRALWRPFWLTNRRIPQWLPLTPSEHVLEVI